MWTWEVKTGRMSQGEKFLASGYSGAGDAKNDPRREQEHNIGPIPRGFYRIGSPVNSPDHGPHAMHLTPEPETEMFGRDAFLIHGDSREHPGAASQGCIILPRFARERITDSGDNKLQVI